MLRSRRFFCGYQDRPYTPYPAKHQLGILAACHEGAERLHISGSVPYPAALEALTLMRHNAVAFFETPRV